MIVVSEQDTADGILTDVLYHAFCTVLEFDDLAVKGVLDSLDAYNSVADKLHVSDFTGFRGNLKRFDSCTQCLRKAAGTGQFFLVQKGRQLGGASLVGPVVFPVAAAYNEPAGKRRIMLRYHLYGLLAGKPGEHAGDPVFLFLRRFCMRVPEKRDVFQIQHGTAPVFEIIHLR